MTRADVGAIAVRPFSLLVRYWPQLAACYLLGVLGRHATIELAAWAGYDNDLWASLIMPMAGMARLGSYVAMFLVLRPALPALTPASRGAVRRIDLFTTVIVPFFAIYIAWRLFREDWVAFETRALDYRIADAMTAAQAGQPVSDIHPGTLPVGPLTWALIGAALVSRWALNRLKDRLPVPLVALRIYIDALWVFLGLSIAANQGFTLLLNPGQWVTQRRIMVWLSDTRAALFSHFHPLEVAWDAAMWVLRTTFGGAAVPLMWLAVAGIVYAVGVDADWRGAVQRMAGQHGAVLIDRSAGTQARVRGDWLKLPKYVREKGAEHANAQIGKFKPVTDAARVILHAGIPALALYVLAYVVLGWLDRTGSFYGLAAGDGYLLRGVAWTLGPHPIQFWGAVDQVLSLVSHLIVEPLRVCLIASAFAYCVENVVRGVTVPGAR